MSIDAARFVEIDVAPGPASADGVMLRFKTAGARRPVREVEYESDEGTGGRWRVWSAGDESGQRHEQASAVPVEDSSDGTTWLVFGGPYGLVLENVTTGAIVREPYLVLAIGTELD